MPYWVRLISAKYRPPAGDRPPAGTSTASLFIRTARVTAFDSRTGAGSAAVTVITPIAATADAISKTSARPVWPAWLRRSRRNGLSMTLPSSRRQHRRDLSRGHDLRR